jgi:mercuric ion binding protein
MKKLILTLSLTLAPLGIFAAEEISVKVKGMVCSFCSTGVEKTFSKRKEVNKVSVDMEKKLVSITLNDNSKMKDELITKLITDSGFNVAEIERTQTKSDVTKK